MLVRKVLFLGNVITGNDSNDGGALTIDHPNNLTVLLEDVSFMYNTATIGSSSLCSISGHFQNITIVDSFFIGNSQDERFSNEWTVAYIFSYNLSCSLIRTVISGNYVKPRVINPKLARRPIHFFVQAFGPSQIDISGIQYKNNTGSGIYIEVADYGSVNSTIISLQNSHFEHNELFSLHIKAGPNILMRMKSIVFKGNTFVSSYLSSVPLFFFYSLAQGNQVIMEDTVLRTIQPQEELYSSNYPRINVIITRVTL